MTQPEPTTPRYCPRCGTGTDVEICADDGSPTFLRTLRDAETRMLAVGDVISGRYRIEGILGQGGFGAVFAAEHLMTGQPVAVKVMVGDFGAGTEDLVQRFLQEARITASLSHPNTVRIYDFGQTKTGVLFMAMEQLRGPTLEARLHTASKAASGLSETETIAIGVQVLRSLTEAHSAGLVHRDLKPGNLILVQMVGEPDIVKVLDFGIARPQDSVLTQTGTALGTPTFMSPEQARSEVPDGRSDLYSLGCILFACVAGQPPFVGDSTMSVLLAHQLHALPNLREAALVPVSEAFVQCIERATAKKAAGRFADAIEMREALEAIVVATPTAPTPADDDVWAPTMENDVIGDVVPAHTLAGDGIADLVSSQTLAVDSVPAPGLVGPEAPNSLPDGVQLPDHEGNETMLNNIIEASPVPRPTPTLRSDARRARSSAEMPTLATPSALRTLGHGTGSRPAARPRSAAAGKQGNRPRGQTSSQQLRARAQVRESGRNAIRPSVVSAAAPHDVGDDRTPVPTVLPTRTQPKAGSRSVVVLLSVAALVAILLAVGAWWALRDGDNAGTVVAASTVPSRAKATPPAKRTAHASATQATPAQGNEDAGGGDPAARDKGASAAGVGQPKATEAKAAEAKAAALPAQKPSAGEPIAAKPTPAPKSQPKAVANNDVEPKRKPIKRVESTSKKPDRVKAKKAAAKAKKPAKRKAPAKKRPKKAVSDEAFDLL